MADPRRSAASFERHPRHDAFDVLLNELVERFFERLAQRITHSTLTARGSEYYSASENPLGSRRAFLDAAHRGDFPSYKAGRRVLAKRADVHHWIESRPRKHSEPPPDDVSNRALLEGVGVRLGGKGRR